MRVEFSVLGSGDDTTNLCFDCRYYIKIHYRDHVPQIRVMTGSQIYEEFENRDVKVTIYSIKRCKRHISHNNNTPYFLKAAIESGIDIVPRVDEYRNNVLKRYHPERII